MMTQAGPEIGVASTKAFTTQLLSMLIVTLILARQRGMSADTEAELVPYVVHAAAAVEEALQMSDELKQLAEDFAEKEHTLFLGRGPMWPVAMEGALKLKEISYIHAEAYAAGELKHGPLALIDEDMPVVVVAPNNELVDKLKSNMQVVRARGGQLYVRIRGSRDGYRGGRWCKGDRNAARGPLDRTHRLHGPAAVAGVSRRGTEGHRRRSAA
jgi:glucosamine--fructose-6-phosphate aminotransferase (isomerizing)